jgi:membrane-bound lytic murein transglycosylase D
VLRLGTAARRAGTPRANLDLSCPGGRGYLADMLILRAVTVVCLASALALAQEEPVTFDDLLESGREWVEENLDPDVVESLGELDEAKAQQFLREFQERFAGEYVIDLAPLRVTAETLLPALERFEETRDQAAWLRARLDYLEVAEEFRVLIPEPGPEPGEPPKPRLNPTPEQERKAWRKQVATRPAPKGAAAHVARLKPVFAAQKLPPELVWLAEVESAFNPRARSPVGAVGLYQLMPATAKALGLATSPDDERLDPEKNATAAAKYLRQLHGRFKDWPLALAAYNCGEGRLQAALTKYEAKTFDEVARRLPAETQMYVPKMDAVLARREQTSLAKLAPPR